MHDVDDPWIVVILYLIFFCYFSTIFDFLQDGSIRQSSSGEEIQTRASSNISGNTFLHIPYDVMLYHIIIILTMSE